MKRERLDVTKAAANATNLTRDEILMQRAGELATRFCKYLESQNLVCDGRVIIRPTGEILYDLRKPSAKFQAIFTWVTKVSLSLRLGKLALEIVKMTGQALFDQRSFPDRSACNSCALDSINPALISRGGNA